MSYTITHANGANSIVIADGTVDNSTSISLVGKNTANYGQFLDQNFLNMLENFANGSAPNHPLPGQLWWDSTNKVLKINSAATKNDTPFWKFIQNEMKITDANLLLSVLQLPPIEKKTPNIKIVHLLMDPNKSEDIPKKNWDSTVSKQNLSIDCFEKLSKKFTSYIQRYSVVNRTKLPSENCMDPQIIRP